MSEPVRKPTWKKWALFVAIVAAALGFGAFMASDHQGSQTARTGYTLLQLAFLGSTLIGLGLSLILDFRKRYRRKRPPVPPETRT